MTGLRTQESIKFKNFFRLVQSEAQKKGGVFFFDTQESTEKIIDDCECMNISGWLVPQEKASQFETVFESFDDTSDWDSFMAWATWEKNNGEISVNIKLL